MPRAIFPMAIADLSAFAKTLRDQIDRLDHKPSHVEMLNLLARAGGFRNYQHFRAESPEMGAGQEPAETSLSAIPAEPAEAPDETLVMRTLRLFDTEGVITRWPTKRSQQELCLWFLWSKVPAGESFSERGISEFLNGLHSFGDTALLRRDMVDLGLMRRKRDGSDYRRVERKPPPELRFLLSRVGQQKRAA